jgi:hypothetical protein
MEEHIEEGFPSFDFHLLLSIHFHDLHFCPHTDQKGVLTKRKLSIKIIKTFVKAS